MMPADSLYLPDVSLPQLCMPTLSIRVRTSAGLLSWVPVVLAVFVLV